MTGIDVIFVSDRIRTSIGKSNETEEVIINVARSRNEIAAIERNGHRFCQRPHGSSSFVGDGKARSSVQVEEVQTHSLLRRSWMRGANVRPHPLTLPNSPHASQVSAYPRHVSSRPSSNISSPSRIKPPARSPSITHITILTDINHHLLLTFLSFLYVSTPSQFAYFVLFLRDNVELRLHQGYRRPQGRRGQGTRPAEDRRGSAGNQGRGWSYAEQGPGGCWGHAEQGW